MHYAGRCSLATAMQLHFPPQLDLAYQCDMISRTCNIVLIDQYLSYHACDSHLIYVHREKCEKFTNLLVWFQSLRQQPLLEDPSIGPHSITIAIYSSLVYIALCAQPQPD